MAKKIENIYMFIGWVTGSSHQSPTAPVVATTGTPRVVILARHTIPYNTRSYLRIIRPAERQRGIDGNRFFFSGHYAWSPVLLLSEWTE